MLLTNEYTNCDTSIHIHITSQKMHMALTRYSIVIFENRIPGKNAFHHSSYTKDLDQTLFRDTAAVLTERRVAKGLCSTGYKTVSNDYSHSHTSHYIKPH